MRCTTDFVRKKVLFLAVLALDAFLLCILILQFAFRKEANVLSLDASTIECISVTTFYGNKLSESATTVLDQDEEINSFLALWNRTWIVEVEPFYRNGEWRVEGITGNSPTVRVTVLQTDGTCFDYMITHLFVFEDSKSDQDRGKFYTFAAGRLNERITEWLSAYPFFNEVSNGA